MNIGFENLNKIENNLSLISDDDNRISREKIKKIKGLEFNIKKKYGSIKEFAIKFNLKMPFNTRGIEGRKKFKEFFFKNKKELILPTGELQRRSYFMSHSNQQFKKWFLLIQRYYPQRQDFYAEFEIKGGKTGMAGWTEENKYNRKVKNRI